MEKVRPTGTVRMGTITDFQDWVKLQEGCELRMAGQESGKNAVFQVVLGCLQYIGDIVDAKHKARIVIDYDPDALNWVMTLFTDKDAPIPKGIR